VRQEKLQVLAFSVCMTSTMNYAMSLSRQSVALFNPNNLQSPRLASWKGMAKCGDIGRTWSVGACRFADASKAMLDIVRDNIGIMEGLFAWRARSEDDVSRGLKSLNLQGLAGGEQDG
jgi:hypothetical protein